MSTPRFIKKQLKSLGRLRARRELYRQIQEKGFPPILWSKGYAALAEQNGGLKEALGRTEKRWTLEKFLRLYDETASSYWIPLTSSANAGRPSPLDWFAEYILPKIEQPFVLITTDGDASVPKSFKEHTLQRLLENEYLELWYSQNITEINYSPKLRGLPIGLDIHRKRSGLIGWNLFNRVRDIALESANKVEVAVVDFCLNKNSESRRYLCKRLQGNDNFLMLSTPLEQLELWRLYSKSRYVISPEGVGPDCHRTWEALYLGASVICKDVGLGHLYKNLPVYQVSSWEELSEPGFFAKVATISEQTQCLWDIPVKAWLSEVRHPLGAEV